MDYREQQELFELKTLDKRAKKSMLSLRTHDEEKDTFRTEYQRDIDRILYSEAFRRLRLKTQTFISRSGDPLNRTRLSHTLEVNQIAKTIAKPNYLNCDLIEAIAFGHDLGQTPFGHAGGKALHKLLQESGKSFHHNAQSVWLAEQLNLDRRDIEGASYSGMNLTHDTLEGIWKHTIFQPSESFGVEILDKLNPQSPGSLEAEVVQIADKFSYVLHDLYDADQNGIARYEEFEESVWHPFFDKPFDKNRWHYAFINDLIEQYGKSTHISFSDHFSSAFTAVQNYIDERILKSRQLLEYDEMAYELISTIYHYFYKHPEALIKRANITPKTFEILGLERVLTDFIQWFGDAGAIVEYETIKNSKSLKAV